MYARYFGLAHQPFSIAPDPRYLFMSERHREALAHLLYGVRHGGGGFVVLTGDVGAGKTTVCRCLLGQLPARCNVAYIFNPKLTVEELLQTICTEFRIPHPQVNAVHTVPTVKNYVDALNEYLLRTHAVNQNNVLMIDEAQNLSADVLDQLRLLTNLETSERKLLQIVLLGQPELRTMLAKPELEQLAQRVIARYHLEPLAEAETAQYIRHRLTVAGLNGPLPFEGRALRRVHQLTQGVPRRINLLCDRALLGAYAKGRSTIDLPTLNDAAQEVFDKPARVGAAAAHWRRAHPELTMAALAGVVLLAVLGLAFMQQRNSAADAAATQLAAVDGARGGSDRADDARVQSKDVAPAGAGAGLVGNGAGNGVGKAGSATALESAADIAPFDLPRGYASLLGAETLAWRELGATFGLPPAEGEPCAAAAKLQMRCYRAGDSTLTLIRQLDRPGVITLRDASNRAAFVTLAGLGTDRAVLRINGVLRSVPLTVLADYWRGEYATYWRAPPDYSGAAQSRWLATQLASARGEAKPQAAVDDATLRGWVHSFQLTQGLPSDGIAGPVTLMVLNRAVGIDEPRLQAQR